MAASGRGRVFSVIGQRDMQSRVKLSSLASPEVDLFYDTLMKI